MTRKKRAKAAIKAAASAMMAGAWAAKVAADLMDGEAAKTMRGEAEEMGARGVALMEAAAALDRGD